MKNKERPKVVRSLSEVSEMGGTLSELSEAVRSGQTSGNPYPPKLVRRVRTVRSTFTVQERIETLKRQRADLTRRIGKARELIQKIDFTLDFLTDTPNR